MGRSSITVEAEADKTNEDATDDSKSATALNHNRQNRSISLSDNEDNDNVVSTIVDKSRQGTFAFDPMGPDNLKDLDLEVNTENQILYQEVEEQTSATAFNGSNEETKK